MTVRELRHLLFEVKNQDAEVRIATQPSWPFENTVGDVVEVIRDSDEVDDCGPGTDLSVVYIGEGEQIGYLPESAKTELSW